MDSSSSTLPAIARQQLSPGTAFYLRRLLRKNMDRLVTPSGGAVTPALLNSLEALASDTDQPANQSLETTLQRLEQLAQRHQSLSNQGLKRRDELRDTEQQIAHLLGLSFKHLSQQATILIVDDTPENLRLLSTTLSDQGYTVRSAINGALALSSARMIKPDLILLDIMMPGLDGYEVCKRLKSDPQTDDIPIIFISAVDAALDKVKAFNVGGVDYITKPFQIEEVLVRIQHQLKIWNLQKRLEAQGQRLEEEIAQRQEADRRSRQLFEQAVSGVYHLAADGTYLQASTRLAQLYGYRSPAEMVELATARTLYARPRQFSQFIHRLQASDVVVGFESQILRPDGQTVWVSETARAVRDEQGNLLYYEGAVIDITARREAEDGWRRGRRRTKRLLLTLFPRAIAQQFGKSPDSTLAQQFDQATVLFAQVIGTAPLVRDLAPVDFLTLLNHIFFDFNRLAERLGVEPLKTMGTCYLAVCGLPTPNPDHALVMAEFALELQQRMVDYQQHSPTLKLRVGLHSGSVTAGVIGRKKLSYDVWGQTVDLAARLEREGSPGKIQTSDTTHELIQGRYRCDRRVSLQLPDGPLQKPVVPYWLQGTR